MAARGIEVPSGWDFSGALSAVSGDGSMVAGWTIGSPDGERSFVVTGIDTPTDKLFADGFEGAAAANPVQDSSFEATTGSGASNPFWDSLDGNPDAAGGTVFDSTLDLGIPTYSGDYAAWFGGWANGSPETQTFSQNVTVPASGPQFLNYWRYAADLPDVASLLTVTVDGNAVETTDMSAITPDSGYAQQSIDVSAYADGAVHTIQFQYDYPGTAGRRRHLHR